MSISEKTSPYGINEKIPLRLRENQIQDQPFLISRGRAFSDEYAKRTYTREEKFKAIETVMGKQKWFQDKIAELGMIQSMSRKGNCQDNSPTENFFGILKEEAFYGREWKYESVIALKRDILLESIM